MESIMFILVAINVVLLILAVLAVVAVVYALEVLFKIAKKTFTPPAEKRRWVWVRFYVCAVYGVVFVAITVFLVIRFVGLPQAVYQGDTVIIDGVRFVEIREDVPLVVSNPNRLDLVRVARDENPPGVGVLALFNIPFYARRGESWPPEFVFYHRGSIWRVYLNERYLYN